MSDKIADQKTVAELAQLVGGGMTVKAAGAQLGIPRNRLYALSSKAQRLGLMGKKKRRRSRKRRAAKAAAAVTVRATAQRTGSTLVTVGNRPDGTWELRGRPQNLMRFLREVEWKGHEHGQL